MLKSLIPLSVIPFALLIIFFINKPKKIDDDIIDNHLINNDVIDDDLLKQILVWYLYRPEDGACSKFGCTKEGARKGVSQEYEKYLQKNIKNGVIILHRSNLVTDKELDTILSTHPYKE